MIQVRFMFSPSLSWPTSYAKLVTEEPIRNVSPTPRKSVNFLTLITPAGNGAEVVVPLESIRAISERNTWGKYGLVKSMLNSSTGLFFFQFSSMDGLDLMLENGQWSSYARAMIKLRADVELKDTIVVAMPKLVREGFYTCTICVEYEWKPPCVRVARGVLVGPKVGFKPVKQVYKPVSKKNNASTSDNKKKDVEFRKEANSGRPLFFNVGSSSTTTTPIVEKIDKLESLIIDGKLTLMDDEGKPLEKVEYSGDHDSEDEVEPVDNEMESFLASKGVGYGTNNLLEQWRETYRNANYDYDPYDDDMYEGQEIPDNI
ncbi:hypothetical protein Tco_1121630 [Tanacetum coccineum]|uniref:DUF4283 domain-containing protein n=1 Tax=Tanacetum coccineum TaxID=301880 RepID=A0ABQ5IZM1_9ASTR